jgi:hypothetical protein
VQYGNMRERERDEEVEEQPTSMHYKTFPFFLSHRLETSTL